MTGSFNGLLNLFFYLMIIGTTSEMLFKFISKFIYFKFRASQLVATSLQSLCLEIIAANHAFHQLSIINSVNKNEEIDISMIFLIMNK